MCRLFGMVSVKPSAIRYWMLDAPRPFRGFSSEHAHGWGIGSSENGKANLVKEPVAAKDSTTFESIASQTMSSMVVAHIRKMTRGRQVLEDTHPFQFGEWIFGHNGTIDADYFIGKLNAVHRNAVKGSSDSEVYFHYLLQGYEAGGESRLLKAIDSVRSREFSALNFVMSNGAMLLAYWDQTATPAKSLTPFYYQLYLTERDSANAGRRVIVCSEKLDNESWTEIPPRRLVKITSDCNVRSVQAH